MNILLIHHRLPYPLFSGMDKVRFNLIRSLSKEYKVTLMVPVDRKIKENDIHKVEEHVEKLISIQVPESKSIKSKPLIYLKRFLLLLIAKEPSYIFNDYIRKFHKEIIKETKTNKYDAIQALSDVSSKYLNNIKCDSDCLKVLGPVDDMIGAIQDDFKYISSWRKKTGKLLELRARKYYLPKICAKADRVIFFSVEDAESIQKYSRKKIKAGIITPPVEETDEFTTGESESNSMIFIGGLGSFFNRNGVFYFIKKIYPAILNEIPDAKLYVVGQSPGKILSQYKDHKNIIITGKVPDIDPYISKAQVYINPVRTGTGLKTKMIEAFRYGKAVVSTPEGIRGLWKIDPSIIFVEDDPDQFAKRCIYLLKNESARQSISRKVREMYESHYSIQKTEQNVFDFYKKFIFNNYN